MIQNLDIRDRAVREMAHLNRSMPLIDRLVFPEQIRFFWPQARQDRSDFPDVDQMLCDIAPVIDERAQASIDFLDDIERIHKELAARMGIPARLLGSL